MWETILATIMSEFSDLDDVERATRVTMRLLIAAFLGGLLGYEREQQGKAAGIRTHMMVGLGAALFVVASLEDEAMNDAMSRVIQGIVAGVGFLGAGTIIKTESLMDVKGLTTAAGIWLTAAIGVAVGLGHEMTALVATLIALVILHTLPLVMKRGEEPGP